MRLWQVSGAGSLVLPVYEPLPGIQLVLRVDHLGLFFAGLGVAAGLLVSLPWLLRPLRRHRPHQGWVLLAQAGMILVALAGGLETLAAGWAMTATALCLLVLVSRLDASGRLVGGGSALWHIALQFSGALLLLAAAVTVEVAAGTGGFDAVPVGAIDSRAFLLALAPVLALLGLGATARAMRDPIGTALAVGSVSVPMACYLLVRLYDLGDGRLPDARLGAAMAVIGGVACLWFAVSSLWAVDLGATLTRLVQATAALLLVAAGAGSGLGVAAVAIGAISVCLGASLAYAVIDAGRGRLPSPGAGGGRRDPAGDRGVAGGAAGAGVGRRGWWRPWHRDPDRDHPGRARRRRCRRAGHPARAGGDRGHAVRGLRRGPLRRWRGALRHRRRQVGAHRRRPAGDVGGRAGDRVPDRGAAGRRCPTHHQRRGQQSPWPPASRAASFPSSCSWC